MIRSRWLAGGFSLSLLSAVLWPMLQNWRPEPQDDFPFSYYPMFSARRGKRVRVTYLQGIDRAGRRVPIAHHIIGPGGFNQVRRQVRAIVKRGGAAELCRKVAPRAVRTHGELVALRVVTGTYALDRFFAGDRAPLAEEVHAELPCGPGAFVDEEL